MKNSVIFRIASVLSLGADDRHNSPAVRVAITAVALSVVVMLIALAVVRGFKQQISDKITGFNAHITVSVPVTDYDPSPVFSLTPTLKNILDTTSFVSSYGLQASVPAILKTPDNFKGVYLKAISSKQSAEFIKENLEEGVIPDTDLPRHNTDSIVISRIAANQLGLNIGDRIETYFMTDDIRVRKLTVAGIYNSRFDNYDDILIFGSLNFIATLGGLSENQGTSLQIFTDDFNDVEKNATTLQRTLDKATAEGLVARRYHVDNALVQGAGYYQWLSLLDTNVAVILSLMLIVACVTLISGMLIIILDKVSAIATLRAIGLSSRKTGSVFILMAMKVAALGMIIGNALALGLLVVQQQTRIIPLDPETYYIDFVPVLINPAEIVMLNIGVLCLAWLTLLLPSRFVARISPAQVLRSNE